MILSFLTNLLIDALNEDCDDGDVQHALSDLLTGEGGVFQFCASFPDVRMFVAFPNVRLRPSWYARQRTGIIQAFHQFLEKSPLNLQLLEDFNGDLGPDQVHFSVLSGMSYVKHLVDRSLELLLHPPPDKFKR